VNKWKDDDHRNRMHQRGLWRRLRTGLRGLLLVTGWVTLAMALFLAVMSLRQSFSARDRLLHLAGQFAGGGGLLVLLHATFFLLPAALEQRRSLSHRRRSSENSRRKRPAPASGREGMALVLVLVALALITTLIVQAQVTARALARHTESRATRAQLLNAATDAARGALQRLADDPDLLADTTNDAWAVTEDLTRPDGLATRTRVSDESSLFDLNNLAVTRAAPEKRTPSDVLFDVFSLCGDFQSSAYLSALEDWMDEGDDGLRESFVYAKRKPPYRPSNRVLFTWEESLHVEGGDQARFQRPAGRTSSRDGFNASLRDCLTLLPVIRTRPLPVNINTASAEVLQGVLGLGQDTLVRTILTLRTIKPIRSFEPLAAVAEPGVLEAVRPYVAVRSDFFRVEVQASGPQRSLQVQALARRDGVGRVDIVQWMFN
jgi:type II secretory pathway component PulK